MAMKFNSRKPNFSDVEYRPVAPTSPSKGDQATKLASLAELGGKNGSASPYPKELNAGEWSLVDELQ